MIFWQVGLLASLLLLHLGLALPVQDGSDQEKTFQLTVIPSLVTRHTSKNMALRCEHNSSVPTQIAQVFRMRIVRKSTSGWELVAEQRDNENQPTVGRGVTASASIKGETSSIFLQAFWDSLEDDNFGVFRCDVTGFDVKVNVITESSSEVDVHEFQNLIGHFVSLSTETKESVIELKNSTETEISDLKKGLENQKTSVAAIENTVFQLKNSTETQISQLKRKLGDIESSLATKSPSLYKTELNKIKTFLGSLIQWPGGHYALLQPRTGCPVDLAFFGGSHKYHKIHTESQSSSDPGDAHSSVFSSMTKFKADGKYFITLEFCEVTRQFNSASWPQGSYCINKLQLESCPTGFSSGRIVIDTEGTDFSGDGRNNVADTVYNPYLFFCCQNSSSADYPIHLPTDSPFLLYRYGGQCQQVQGMSVSEEFIQINTEDNSNRDSLSDNHPDVDQPGSSVIKFNLCYYTKD